MVKKIVCILGIHSYEKWGEIKSPVPGTKCYLFVCRNCGMRKKVFTVSGEQGEWIVKKEIYFPRHCDVMPRNES